MGLTVATLRALFRHYQQFWSVYETEGVDSLVAPDGTIWSLWDLQYLYEQARNLTPRQFQAIEWFLVRGLRESDVAVMMGLLPSNPIGMYATDGLNTLIRWATEGRLPRFRVEDTVAA